MGTFRMPSESGFDVGHNSGGGIAVADPNELDSLLGNDTPALSIHQPEAETDAGDNDENPSVETLAAWAGMAPDESGHETDPDATPPDNGDDASDAPELDEAGQGDGDGDGDEISDALDGQWEKIDLDPVTGEVVLTPAPVSDVATDETELPPGSVTEAFQEAANVEAETPITVAGDSQPPHDTTTGPPAATISVADAAAAQSQAEADFAESIQEASIELAQAVIVRAKAEGALKAAKSIEKYAIERMLELAERGPESLPLFDGKMVSEEVKHSFTSEETSACETGNTAAATTTDDDSWRTTLLTTIPGIPARALKALAELDVTTIGELADVAADGGKLTDLKGIGKAAAEKIQEATEQWHKERLASMGATEVEPVEYVGGEELHAAVHELAGDSAPLDSAPLDSDHTTDVDLLDSNGVPVDWREVSCEHMKITDKQLNKLYQQGLDTLGEFADWTANPANDLTSVGFTPLTAGKIMAAFEALKAKYEGVAAGHGDQADQSEAEQPATAAATAPQSIGDDILE